MKESDHLEDLDVDRRMMLQWVLKMWKWGAWTGFISPGIGTSCCKQSTNKTVGTVK